MVRLETTIKRFIGLSRDRFAGRVSLEDGSTFSTDEIPAGSSFFESDTGLTRRWTGSGWTEAFPEPENEELKVLVDISRAILVELRAARTESETGLPVETSSLLP